jgi:hypothetical protein
VAVEASVCPHCDREIEAVHGTCPNCGKPRDGGTSVFERAETRSSARGELDDWLSMGLLLVPGVVLVIVGLVVVESAALVIVGVGVLIAPALINFLLDESDGTWW